jgi:hypothetical protein
MRLPTTRLSLLRPASRWLRPTLYHVAPHARFQSTSTTSDANIPATASLPPRWLSDVRTRIGKCINFGIDTAQIAEGGAILQEISTDWRELVAGSEGFLTGKEWRGLYRQEVVWGEMVSSIYILQE